MNISFFFTDIDSVRTQFSLASAVITMLKLKHKTT